jgi:hypothetical protein
MVCSNKRGGWLYQQSDHQNDLRSLAAPRTTGGEMKLLAVALVVLALGCGGMTNDEIITEVNKCRRAGFDAKVLHGGLTNDPISVECVPCDAARADSLRKMAEAE